jgi:hypothetical protein
MDNDYMAFELLKSNFMDNFRIWLMHDFLYSLETDDDIRRDIKATVRSNWIQSMYNMSSCGVKLGSLTGYYDNALLLSELMHSHAKKVIDEIVEIYQSVPEGLSIPPTAYEAAAINIYNLEVHIQDIKREKQISLGETNQFKRYHFDEFAKRPDSLPPELKAIHLQLQEKYEEAKKIEDENVLLLKENMDPLYFGRSLMMPILNPTNLMID